MSVRAYILAARGRAYRCGRHDCALFVAGWLAERLGLDAAARYGRRYTTKRGGLRVLRRDGFRDPAAWADAHLVRIAPSMARSGDVAMLAGGAFGLVHGAQVWALTPEGPAPVPLGAARRAWRVG